MVEPMDGRTEELERELREHLRARSAPAGFADRLMARIPAERKPRPMLIAQPVWRWAAIAAVVAVTFLGGLEHSRQQRIAGEHARQQVLLALRITGTTLREVQQKVQTPQQ
ncbi:MAG: hypothetical protein WA414_18050 [Acidobacteriaceae bacterium]